MIDALGNPVGNAYDTLYRELSRSPTLRDIWRRHVLGDDYPAGFEHLSFLTFSELRRVAIAVGLRRGGRLLDLGCGTGGPGLWVAREASARLIGVDAALSGIVHARTRAQEHRLSATTHFATGTFEQLPMMANSVDAVMSVDALQYARNKETTLRNVALTLRPGGRFVFTVFEMHPATTDIPFLGADPLGDYRPVLTRAGFGIDVYEETAGWRERVEATYRAIMDAIGTIADEIGLLATTALRFEVALVLARPVYLRRMFGIAVKR